MLHQFFLKMLAKKELTPGNQSVASSRQASHHVSATTIFHHRGDSAKWPKQTSMKKSSDPASVCSHNPKHKLLQVLGSKYAYIMLHHK